MRIRAALALVALCSYSAIGLAQQDTPEDVARQHFAALQSEGVASVVRFLHPQALAQFKDMVMPIYEAEERANERDLRGVTFGESATIEQIRGLEPDEFMRGFMNLVTAELGNETVNFDKLEVIGVVPEGELRHVVVRITVAAEGISMTEYEVLSFLPFQNTWRMQLTGELEGLAAALRQSLDE